MNAMFATGNPPTPSRDPEPIAAAVSGSIKGTEQSPGLFPPTKIRPKPELKRLKFCPMPGVAGSNPAVA